MSVSAVIAVPTEAGNVNPHFGRSRVFTLVQVADSRVSGSQELDLSEFQHQHEGIVALLRSKGVDTVIAGAMGMGMYQALQDAGLQVITGASGPVLQAVQAFVEGRLQDKGAIHPSHHHHDM